MQEILGVSPIYRRPSRTTDRDVCARASREHSLPYRLYQRRFVTAGTNWRSPIYSARDISLTISAWAIYAVVRGERLGV
jgi:hypothetical protein